MYSRRSRSQRKAGAKIGRGSKQRKKKRKMRNGRMFKMMSFEKLDK
jgi:hypothetical protein